MDRILNEAYSRDTNAFYAKRPNSYQCKGKPRDGVYLGIEYETGVNARQAQRFIDGVKSMGYIGRDSSLYGENAIEFRAHPMSFEKARNSWNRFFKKYSNTVTFETNGGIHIHCTKAPLSHEQWVRVAFFINRLSNRQYLYFVSNRMGQSSRYTDVHSLQEMGVFINGTGHGHAFGYRVNDGTTTIEIRIFKTTVDHRTFMSYIEFTRALLDFCKSTASEEKLVSEAFYTYLRSKKRRYPNILARTEEFFRQQ